MVGSECGAIRRTRWKRHHSTPGLGWRFKSKPPHMHRIMAKTFMLMVMFGLDRYLGLLFYNNSDYNNCIIDCQKTDSLQ